MLILIDVPAMVRCPVCRRWVGPGLPARVLPWHRRRLAEPTPCTGEGLPVAELVEVSS